jgi:NAD(P)-dependent dehydrogenase (short-subunit alcohol dehydrogenase family)
MKTIAEERARLDVLVNNAGVIHVTPIAEEDLTAWKRLLDINLTGAFLGIRAALPLLEAAGGGSIINISSIFGPAGAIGYAAYAASKAGLLGLTRTAALELASKNIRVNAVCPGGVSTPMNENERDGGVVRKRRSGGVQTHPRSRVRLRSWRAAIRRSSPAQSSSSTAVFWPTEFLAQRFQRCDLDGIRRSRPPPPMRSRGPPMTSQPR